MKVLYILICTLFVTSLRAQSPRTEKERPQTPIAPFAYTSENFQFENKEADITLNGTLTLPEGEGPFSVAILISGSGPTDRDQTIFDHKIFLVIADHLTRQGIAVLRYDDRGVGESNGSHYNATSMDLADDTQAAVVALSKHKKINAQHIGLIGHSEGGMIAPIVASKSTIVDFIILLAGPGVPINETMVEQNQQVYKSYGLPQKELTKHETFCRSLYDIIDNDKPISELYDTLIPFIHTYYDSIPDEHKSLFSPTKEVFYISLVGGLGSPWFRYFLQFDPTPYLRNTHCPILALNGSKDIQVISSQNLQGIEKTLTASDHQDFTIKELPGLNHLFQACDKCTVEEYEELEETFSKEVLDMMSSWILDRVK